MIFAADDCGIGMAPVEHVVSVSIAAHPLQKRKGRAPSVGMAWAIPLRRVTRRAAADCRKKILHNLDILFRAHRNLSFSLTSSVSRVIRRFGIILTRAKSRRHRLITAAS